MHQELSEISSIQEEKNVLRLDIESRDLGGQVGVNHAGRSAELLRRSPAYRKAKQVFVDPGPDLQQVRINCLADGKELVMPSAGLKEGFYFFKPYTISFRELAFAVSSKGAAKFAKRLSEKQVTALDLNLVVTGAVAVDRHGGRLGDGSGFFDLSYAILLSVGAMSKNAPVAALIAKEQIVEGHLPVCCWDVPASLLVCQDEVHTLADTPTPSGEIYWDQLSPKRIRKMKPLWLIRNQKTKDSGQKG